jgi:hypothetical protein
MSALPRFDSVELGAGAVPASAAEDFARLAAEGGAHDALRIEPRLFVVARIAQHVFEQDRQRVGQLLGALDARNRIVFVRQAPGFEHRGGLTSFVEHVPSLRALPSGAPI